MISKMEYKLLKEIEEIIDKLRNRFVVKEKDILDDDYLFKSEMIDVAMNEIKSKINLNLHEVFVLDCIMRNNNKIITKFFQEDIYAFFLSDISMLEMGVYEENELERTRRDADSKKQTFALYITTIALVASIVFNILFIVFG